MNPYRARLLAVSNEITEPEFSDLKFLCKEHFGGGILEKVSRPLELFDLLERDGLLGCENNDYLIALLESIHRGDLTRVLVGDTGNKIPYVDKTLLTLKSALQEHYKNVIGWLQPLNWNDTFRLHIKQIYTNLELIKHNSQGSSYNRQPMSSYEDMFQSKMKRILIEGKAGVGKSTLASEMVYDWATGESNAKFKLVFLIELRQVNKSIKEAMFDLLFPKDFSISCEQLYSYITLHQDEILFILDGYDEINPSVVPDLQDLITGKILKNSTVVVTTRPGKGSKIHWYMDIRVEVTGFTAENMNQYIRKYFQHNPEDGEALISDLSMNPVSENIARIPFTTLLICAMWEEMPHSQVLSTMSGLFIELTLSLVKRYYIREKIEVEIEAENITVLDDIPAKLYQSLLSLGEVALTGLLEDQLIFNKKFLETKGCNSEIFELGFLSLERSASRLKPVQMCRFVHRSYQEFLAAFWLTDKIKKALKNPLVYEETAVYIMKCLKGELFTVLFSFTPGLLGKNFERFFEILIQEGVQYVSDEGEQYFFMVCVQALYESQQGDLAIMLSNNLVVNDTIRLKTADPTPYGIRSLAYFLQNSSNVQTLIFEDCFLAERNLATLARCLFETKNLKELHLVNSFAVSEAMNFFTENLKSLSIEKLVVSKSKVLIKNLATVIQCCPKLCEIEMNYNETSEEDLNLLLGALRTLPKFERISISREKLSVPNVESLCSLIIKNSKLTHVALNKITFFEVKDISTILNSLCCCTGTLTSLLFSEPVVEIGGKTAKTKMKRSVVNGESLYPTLVSVLPKLQTLTHLDLSRNELSGWKDVQPCIQDLKLLQNLNLSGNSIGDEAVEKLTEILPNFPHLEELHLAWDKITCQGAIVLATKLNCLRELKVLSLKSNEISDDGAAAIFEAMAQIPSMKEILLENNFITDKGFLSVIVNAVKMRKLECLNLKRNLFGEIGILTLAESLESLPQLKRLVIGCPVVYNDEASDLPDFVDGHPNQFKYIYKKLSSDVFLCVMDAAHKHSSLQEIYLNMNAMPESVDPNEFPKMKFGTHYVN